MARSRRAASARQNASSASDFRAAQAVIDVNEAGDRGTELRGEVAQQEPGQRD